MQIFKPVQTLFPVEIDVVFIYFLSGGVKLTAKTFTFVDFDWEKCIEMA